MEKLTITKVNYTDKKKDGSPILNKWGKPTYKTGIQTNEYGDTWINGFLPFPPDKWEGTQQELEITDDPKWGKQFKLPPRENRGGMSVEQYQKLYAEVFATRQAVVMIRQLLEEAGQIKAAPQVAKGVEYPQGDPTTAFDDPMDDQWAGMDVQ